MENIKLSKVVKYSRVISIALVVFVVFALPAILSFGIKFIPYSYQTPLSNTEDIFEGKSVRQYFYAKENKLTAIGMSLKNPNLVNKKDIILNLYKGESLIATSTINGQVIPDGDLVKFVFNPIENSKENYYSFTLSAPQVDKEHALSVYYTNHPDDVVGDLYVDGMQTKIPLSIITYYKPQSRLSLVAGLYSGGMNKFFADKEFSSIYLMILSVLLGFLVLNRRKS